MSLNEDFETLSPPAEVQKAYDQASGATLSGEKLRPWTIGRQSAAMSLGVSIVKAIGPDIPEMLKKGAWPNVLRDVILCTWLCSLPDHAVTRINCACGEPDVQKAFEWAEAKGMTYGSPIFFEGLKLVDSIVSGILASFYSVDAGTPAEVKKKESTNQPGKSKLPTRRRKPADTQPTTS